MLVNFAVSRWGMGIRGMRSRVFFWLRGKLPDADQLLLSCRPAKQAQRLTCLYCASRQLLGEFAVARQRRTGLHKPRENPARPSIRQPSVRYIALTIFLQERSVEA